MSKDIKYFSYLILISCYIYLFYKFINFNYEIIIIYFITLFIGYLFLNKHIIYCNLILLIIYEIFFVNIEGTSLAKNSKNASNDDNREKSAEKGIAGFETKSKSKGDAAMDQGADQAFLESDTTN